MSARPKKLINDPRNILPEMLEGFAAAYSDIIRLTETGLIVRREPKDSGKVALVIGNGSGHEPAMIGLVGEGLLDVNVPGEIFTAPGPERIVEGIRAAGHNAGVLLCVSHHTGDLLNAEIAMELCAAEGIGNVDMVVLYDDVSSAPRGQETQRRGTTGLFFVWKMLGAYAETGADLKACKAMAEGIRDRTRSITMALSPAANPISRQPMFELPDNEIEIGMGVHGEVGQGRRNLVSADDTIDAMLPIILEDLPFQQGDEVLVMLNNSGSLTQMELFILYRQVVHRLTQHGIRIYGSWIGAYATTQEMAGFGLSLCRVNQALKRLWDMPANGAAVKM